MAILSPSPVPSPVLSDLMRFLEASPTPYHAVESAQLRLTAAGFQAISEQADWSRLAPGKYHFVRGDSALVAFVVPQEQALAARLVGAHTDSPNLRLKSKTAWSKEGYLQLGAEPYGGVLLSSWLDRDLALAGRVIVHTEHGTETRLVRLNNVLVRVPQLAIHLDREVNERGLVLNKQEHLHPVLGLGDGERAKTLLEALCAEAAGVSPGQVVQHELMLFDTTPPALGGLNKEFIYSARLDNLAMCHAAVTALIACGDRPAANTIPLVVLFDHEEVGSESAYGAGSPLLANVLERLVSSQGGSREDFLRLITRSVCISADMGHAVHPNYADRHDARHRPVLNGGPVIKVNTQQRYATCVHTAAMFANVCQEAGIPVQYYAHRSDLPCGSTIGPITAAQLGIRTVDIGNPMLSMHSIREMGGSQDPIWRTQALQAFFTRNELL